MNRGFLSPKSVKDKAGACSIDGGDLDARMIGNDKVDVGLWTKEDSYDTKENKCNECY
jgi:hypothetical protein